MTKSFHSWENIQMQSNQNMRVICAPILNAAQFTIAKIWNQPSHNKG